MTHAPARRWRPQRLLFRLFLLVPAVLLLYVAGRHAWAWYHFRAAERDIEQFAFARALPHLQCSLEVWPSSLPTCLLAARTARRAGLLDEAQNYLEQLDRLGPSDPDRLLEILLLRCQRGLASAADENDLWALVKHGQPQSCLILEALALGNLYTYRLGAAKKAADLLLETQPNHVQAYVWRGWIREGMHRSQEARADYVQALALNPEHAGARLRLAQLLLGLGTPREALDHFLHLRRKGDASLALLLGLAMCRKRLGEVEEARGLLAEARARFPDSAAVLRQQGILALEAGQPEVAEPLLRRALRREPFDAQACYSLAQALAQQGQREAAREFQARARRIDLDEQHLREIVGQLGLRPDDAALHCAAGLICLRNGQAEEGVRWLKGALLADVRYGPAHQALAEYYEQAGQPGLARLHRQEASAKPPAQAAARP
jgi:tetratricopeptide (TPR) repeat protein